MFYSFYSWLLWILSIGGTNKLCTLAINISVKIWTHAVHLLIFDFVLTHNATSKNAFICAIVINKLRLISLMVHVQKLITRKLILYDISSSFVDLLIIINRGYILCELSTMKVLWLILQIYNSLWLCLLKLSSYRATDSNFLACILNLHSFLETHTSFAHCLFMGCFMFLELWFMTSINARLLLFPIIARMTQMSLHILILCLH